MDFLTFVTKLFWPGIAIYILIEYRKPLKEFIKTIINEWEELQYKGVGVKRNRAGKIEPPEPTGKTVSGALEELSEEAKMVISTLWKHQQEYYTDHTQGRWSFAVGIGSPRYADFSIGVGQAMKKGLVTISPQNSQCLLTDAGIDFCSKNKDKLFTDWNFDKWKSLN